MSSWWLRHHPLGPRPQDRQGICVDEMGLLGLGHSRCSGLSLCFWDMSSSMCSRWGVLCYVKGFGWVFCPLLFQNEEDKASPFSEMQQTRKALKS